MIAVRWGMLLLATLPVLAVLGATAAELQPSTQRLLVTAVVGLLAPLFWPGLGATAARTAQRIAGWSVAAAGLAALLLAALAPASQALGRSAGGCLMLLLILLPAHALAAALETRWHGAPRDAAGARAGAAVALTLAMIGALPLWLGPVAEGLAPRQAWVVDAIVGASPLTHLAVASGNDLLHNEWLYQHANLAALPVSYPSLGELTLSYLLAGLALATVALLLQRGHRRTGRADHRLPTPENTP